MLGKLFFQFQLRLQKESLGAIFTSPLDVILEKGVNVVQPERYVRIKHLPNGIHFILSDEWILCENWHLLKVSLAN